MSSAFPLRSPLNSTMKYKWKKKKNSLPQESGKVVI